MGLESLHMRLARLLAARDSDMSFEAGGRAVGKGEHEERQIPVAVFAPNPPFPSSIPCPENTKHQKNLPETFDFGQGLNDKRGQENSRKASLSVKA